MNFMGFDIGEYLNIIHPGENKKLRVANAPEKNSIKEVFIK